MTYVYFKDFVHKSEISSGCIWVVELNLVLFQKLHCKLNFFKAIDQNGELKYSCMFNVVLSSG